MATSTRPAITGLLIVLALILLSLIYGMFGCTSSTENFEQRDDIMSRDYNPSEQDQDMSPRNRNDRYNNDRYNNDRYNNDRYNNDRYNNDRYRDDRDGYRNDRYRDDRDGYRNDRYRDDRDGYRDDRDGYRNDRDGYRDDRDGYRNDRDRNDIDEYRDDRDRNERYRESPENMSPQERPIQDMPVRGVNTRGSDSEWCRGGPPSSVSGNCQPLCVGQQLEWSNNGMMTLSPKKCNEIDRSNDYMLCPSQDECRQGPWYKTPIGAKDKSSLINDHLDGELSREPSIAPQGDVIVPGRSQQNSLNNDSNYPSDPAFNGGVHHHHYYEGSEKRRWNQEVIPASPYLTNSNQGISNLSHQMSPANHNNDNGCSNEHGCPLSMNGEISGVSASNVSCYERF